ncbi:MAG TPA: leucyl aminopeptidase [Rhabdochlamydiaceae bacterium]|jgi:leucyl aminopeptidase
MQTKCVAKSAQRPSADVIVIPVWEGKKKGEIACAETEYRDLIRFPLESGDFHGKEGETLLLYLPKGKEKRALLLGLGKQSECSSESLRKAYAYAVKAVGCKRLSSVNFLLPSLLHKEPAKYHRAIFEGVLLAAYSFDQLKGESLKELKEHHLHKVCFCGASSKEKEQLERTEAITASVNFVRDLVNRNADDKHIGTLAHIAKELEKQSKKIKTTLLDKKHLEQLEMGLLLAVGRGAAREPMLAIIEYQGDPHSKDVTAVIGKGITFDTGGLNLKPTGSIEAMKCDMAGAAATLGVMRAAAQLELKVNLLGVLALAENAIGPNSYKPGDVYRSYSGKTVEISNTDAEGRLVLADAISYVQEKYKPNRIIDMATLTGGIVIALGESATGLFSTDTSLAHALEKAAERTDERVWRMPLYPEYKAMLKSSIADLKNSGGKLASPCSAAAFLQQFVKIPSWAHLDIAGTAYLSDLKHTPYHSTPATGVGVRLLIDFLEHL